MIPHINDGPPTIGKYYWVPSLHIERLPEVIGAWKGVLCPVIGTLHEDAEFINFPDEHYHIDWRFVPGRIFKHSWDEHTALGESGVYAKVTAFNGTPHTTEKPHLAKRRCLREWPPFPSHAAKWMDALEEAYKDHRMGSKWICPHRGMPLKSCPAKDGVVTCPGHGLRWNARTGELVTGARRPGDQYRIPGIKLLMDLPYGDPLVLKQRFIKCCDCRSDSLMLMDPFGYPAAPPLCRKCTNPWKFDGA